MEELIKYLAQNVIERLDELEAEPGFKNLENIEEQNLKGEAYTLINEIQTLKRRLSQIQEYASY